MKTCQKRLNTEAKEPWCRSKRDLYARGEHACYVKRDLHAIMSQEPLDTETKETCSKDSSKDIMSKEPLETKETCMYVANMRAMSTDRPITTPRQSLVFHHLWTVVKTEVKTVVKTMSTDRPIPGSLSSSTTCGCTYI